MPDFFPIKKQSDFDTLYRIYDYMALWDETRDDISGADLMDFISQVMTAWHDHDLIPPPPQHRYHPDSHYPEPEVLEHPMEPGDGYTLDVLPEGLQTLHRATDGRYFHHNPATRNTIEVGVKSAKILIAHFKPDLKDDS